MESPNRSSNGMAQDILSAKAVPESPEVREVIAVRIVNGDYLALHDYYATLDKERVFGSIEGTLDKEGVLESPERTLEGLVAIRRKWLPWLVTEIGDEEELGTCSLLVLAVLLGRRHCVMEVLRHAPDLTQPLLCYQSSPLWSLHGFTALQIAQVHCKTDIMDLLVNTRLELDKETEYEQLQEKLVELKKSYDTIVANYTEHEQDIREMMRFVKGESKRKGYARRL